MSALAAILLTAALFAGFGWLQRGQAAPRGCGGCASAAAHTRCGGCAAPPDAGGPP
jgi:hypothetical protein